MTQRTQKALTLASNVGLGAAFAGLFNALLGPIEDSMPGGRLTYVLVVPPLSFAFFFLLVLPLAYLFPPSSVEPDLSLRFEGARNVIWPVIGLLSGAVVWFVLRSR